MRLEYQLRASRVPSSWRISHSTFCSATVMRCLQFLSVACAIDTASGFGLGGARIAGHRSAASSTRRQGTSMVVPAGSDISAGAQLLLAYSDEATTAAKSVSQSVQLIGLASVGTVGLFGLLASALKLPQAGKIELTEQEQEAVDAATLLYDSTPQLQELTEKGTVGEVKRRELAMSAREKYQRGKDPREVRGKTLSYAEFDLPYLAKMLRLAQLDDGDVFLDMGSGTGKAVVAAGLLYPNLSVCRGVEILEGLHRESKTYARKYNGLRREKAPIEFVQGEFMDEACDVSDVDIVFAYATKYSTERGIYLTELSTKLLDLKSGAKVITIDKRLQGPFNLISTVLDPNGDLQTSTGFLWQRQ